MSRVSRYVECRGIEGLDVLHTWSQRKLTSRVESDVEPASSLRRAYVELLASSVEARAQVDFDLTSTACMHTIRRDHTTSTDFPAAPTASGMLAVMIEKQPRQWDHVWRAQCPLVIVKRCYERHRDRRRTEAQIGENGCKTICQPPLYGSCV